MASVELRPGDVLNIIWTSVQETPLGIQEVESSFAFPYDELLSRLKTNDVGKSRRSGTSGARFSRLVALSTNALHKGKWSTGADIDRDEVFEKLLSKFKDLEVSEYKNITRNARKSISNLCENADYLSSEQKRSLKDMALSISSHYY